ncbi:MAG TPA: phosphatidate cytidylyltransferase [Lacipirellulaceae bacterium]|jgi:phosphatidate cytidylyltransferase
MAAQDWALAGIVIGLLALATVVGQIVKRQPHLGLHTAAIDAFNGRVRAWWIICSLLAVAFISHGLTVALFGFMSFWALREFITLTPTRLGDHRALFWVFFFFTPLQYILIWMGQDKYALSSILIPVYAFLFIPARIALSGDFKRFLERVAKIQSGLLICVYCLSFAPALLYLPVGGAERSGNARLLFFFVTMALLSEAMQFIWSRLYGRHVIAPSINAARTWEGLIGGTVSAALVGMILFWATPFDLWQAALMSMIIAVMGFAGSMTMSAIKRDRGVSDYGTLVEGHGGVLDRIDAICFAAPVFYHVTRQIFGIS